MSTDFEEYARARAAPLLRFAYLIARDRHLAEDLVQEALSKAHRSWHRIERIDNPDLYVRRIVVNQLLSWRRRRSWFAELTVAELPEGWTNSDVATEVVQRDAVWSMLAGLPPRQRAVIVLRFYEQLPDWDIAQVLGCSEATVRSHASKALARLRAATPEGVIA